MCGSPDCEFAFTTSVERSDGLLKIWDNGVFSLQRKYNREHVVILEEEWGEGKHLVIIVSVYAPCKAKRKQIL